MWHDNSNSMKKKKHFNTWFICTKSLMWGFKNESFQQCSASTMYISIKNGTYLSYKWSKWILSNLLNSYLYKFMLLEGAFGRYYFFTLLIDRKQQTINSLNSEILVHCKFLGWWFQNQISIILVSHKWVQSL